MPRRILMLLTCTAACSAPVHSYPAEHVERVVLSPPVELPEPAVDTGSTRDAGPPIDLSGTWVTGSTNEPAVPRFVLQMECNYSPSVWAIDQSGDTVRAYTIGESRAQGVASPPPVRPVPSEGRIVGVNVRMRGPDTRYVLRYDRASGHLRGTLNGAPFWAVREERRWPQDCIAVPQARAETGSPRDALPKPRPEVVAPMDDTLPGPASGDDLSGAWATGSEGEPTTPSIVVHRVCNYSAGYWALAQQGDTVRAYVVPEQRAKGVATPPQPEPIAAEGRLRNGRLVMTGGGNHYRLRYDAGSGHLRGTLNGAPFWAARLAFVEPRNCMQVR